MKRWFVVCAAAVALTPLVVQNQVSGQGGRSPAAASVSAKAAAPYDLTGYWVAVVTENWRLRMVPPPKGDYIGIPISVAGKQAADAWDLARDEAAGNQCKYYGAAAIMNIPTRLHVTWQDDNTLRTDVDAGTQTRVFHFGGAAPAGTRRTWQGYSKAMWEGRRGPAAGAKYLAVETSQMLPGYLRKNGVPYGDKAVLTEFFDVFPQPRGEPPLMVVTAVVEDPVYLEQRYVVVSHFRKQADASGWDPTPCSARW